MESKEIILSRIIAIMSKGHFLKKSNSEFKARLKCVGLGELFEKYSDYLLPYKYNHYNGGVYEHDNEEYDIFLGLDYIFSELYKETKMSDIIALLRELTKSFNVPYITEFYLVEFEEISNLYSLLGLSIKIENDNLIVESEMTSTNVSRIDENFSLEIWLMNNHKAVYDAYESAIDAYTQGHAGACIESCRTCLVSIFEKYKGTDSFAKWMRGVYNTNGDSNDTQVSDLDRALKNALSKKDLAEFFDENREGKLTKTKAIYMIYSMMSDYGTHRNEASYEIPSMEDALLSLRLMDSIMFWIYSKKK